jgi:hypothetical protein
METRRRLPRQEADWPGKYHFAESDAADGICRVVDISRMGIGVELFGSRPPDLIGKRLVVDVQGPAGGSVRIAMEGFVRHVVPISNGGIRVGVEFTGLTEVERAILDSLEQMQVGW